MKFHYPLLLAISLMLAPLPADPAPEVPEFKFSLSYMEPAIPPGVDFFRYACGTWVKANKIPGDRSSWGPSESLVENNTLYLKKLCEEASTDPKGDAARRLVGNFYASAMDTAKVESLAWEPIKGQVAKIAAVKDLAEFTTQMASLQLRGTNSLFGWWVGADSKQSDLNAFHFSQGGLTMPERDYYLHADFKKELAAFQVHLGKMFTLSGDDAAAAASHAATVIRLETALARASKPAEDLNDALANYHKLTVDELEKSAPGISWSAFWNVMNLRPETVVVGQPEFLQAAAKLLASEPLEDWKIYLRWHFMTTSAPYLHKAADDEDFVFFGTVLEGKQEQSLRWKRAIKTVDLSLGDALGQMYVAERFPAEAKARMEEMMANIKAVYADHIRGTAWMSPATREKALAKLSKFRAKLGYPSKWKDYAGLEIRRDDYVGNIQRAYEWEMKRVLARVGKPVDREEWSMTAPTVNAYYDQNYNEIVFPAGILQPPFFDLKMDDAVNYGATGAVIGHELTHGFDSEGRKFNGSGNLEDWWTEADAKEFDRRANGLVQAFNSYDALPGLKVNGKLTLPENIADLGGIVLAYEGLQRALEAAPEKKVSIGGFTPQQRYFISYTQSWMQLAKNEIIRKRNASDPHAPDKLRAVAPLQNYAPWYEAFGITPKDKMWLEPAKRVVIW